MPPETNTPSTPSAGSNKMLYIIGGVVALLILGWFLMRGAALTGAPAGVDADRNMDGSTTYSNEEGIVTVGGGSMPDNWPSDAPQNYAGASIQYSGTSNPATGQAGSAVVYVVKATPQEVAAYYQTELAAKGWAIEGTANLGGGIVVAAKKDTRTFAAQIMQSAEGQTGVTVGIEL